MSPRRTGRSPDLLLLDEMFSPRIVDLLSNRGIDAISVAASAQLCSASDVIVLNHAVDQQRVLVTNNVRDFESLRRACVGFGEPVPPLIYTADSVFPRSRWYIPVLASALENAAREHLAEANGGVVWLSPAITIRTRE